MHITKIVAHFVACELGSVYLGYQYYHYHVAGVSAKLDKWCVMNYRYPSN